MVAPRAFQPALTNLLQSAARLSENSGKYRANIESQLNSLKQGASQYLDSARTAQQQLQDHQASVANAGQPQLISALNALAQHLENAIQQVQGGTNDLLYNSTRHLDGMTNAVNSFQQSANKMAAG